ATALGPRTFLVEAQDAAINILSLPNALPIFDTTAPVAPSLTLAHDTGSLNSDRITSDPSITYTASAAGDTLLYKADGAAGFSSKAPGAHARGTAAGRHTVPADEQEAAGNISA